MIHRIGSEIISTNTYNYPNGIWILFSKKKKISIKNFMLRQMKRFGQKVESVSVIRNTDTCHQRFKTLL